MKDQNLNLKILFQSLTCKMYMSGAMILLSFISIYSPRYSGTPDTTTDRPVRVAGTLMGPYGFTWVIYTLDFAKRGT